MRSMIPTSFGIPMAPRSISIVAARSRAFYSWTKEMKHVLFPVVTGRNHGGKTKRFATPSPRSS
jgi:hypothetical protein